MKVWRFEYNFPGSQRLGIYHQFDEPIHDLHDILATRYSALSGGKSHPMPFDDKLFCENFQKHFKFPLVRKNFVCKLALFTCVFGFSSIESLKSWFDYKEIFMLMEGHDVVVAEYDVPESEVIIGTTQCAFNSSYHHATHRIGDITPKAFAELHFPA